MVICPEAIKAQNNIAAVSAEGSTVWVLIRRFNSSCNRSIAFDVRIDFHWLFGNRVKVNSLSPASSKLSRLHQLNAICAILGASDRDKSLDLRGLGCANACSADQAPCAAVGEARVCV